MVCLYQKLNPTSTCSDAGAGAGVGARRPRFLRELEAVPLRYGEIGEKRIGVGIGVGVERRGSFEAEPAIRVSLGGSSFPAIHPSCNGTGTGTGLGFKCQLVNRSIRCETSE